MQDVNAFLTKLKQFNKFNVLCRESFFKRNNKLVHIKIKHYFDLKKNPLGRLKIVEGVGRDCFFIDIVLQDKRVESCAVFINHAGQTGFVIVNESKTRINKYASLVELFENIEETYNTQQY